MASQRKNRLKLRGEKRSSKTADKNARELKKAKPRAK